MNRFSYFAFYAFLEVRWFGPPGLGEEGRVESEERGAGSVACRAERGERRAESVECGEYFVGKEFVSIGAHS